MSCAVCSTGNAAAAWGARLAEVDYVPAFPITPQTEIIDTLARWCQDGELPAKLIMMDSEHSMLAAALGAAATGVRVFTATSSQGLVYAFEMLYAIAGLRLPLVLVNVSRALANPITLEPDHNDVLSARDTGFLQFHCETSQEVLDSILLGYRLAEPAKILLPVIVNLDGFYLSFTREPIDVPDLAEVRQFLPRFAPAYSVLSDKDSVALGATVLDPSLYTYFKHQMHRAAEEYLKRQGRFRHLFEPERDAETIAHIQATVDDYWQTALRDSPTSFLPRNAGEDEGGVSNNDEIMMQNIFDFADDLGP